MLKTKAFVFSPIQENTYVVYNAQNECAIIDPGCYFGMGLKPVLLLNTHCHLDHVFGNKFISDTYHLELAIHEKEKAMLDFAPSSGLMYNMPFDNYTGEIRHIRENDLLHIGGEQLQVIEAPGHSPGHVCFYCAADGFILSGDVLFNRSIGRTDLPGGSFPQLLKNIREKLFILPDDTVVYSGHGPKTTIGEEKRENPFLVN
jgi:hydroxyacylglutathione hydrolase